MKEPTKNNPNRDSNGGLEGDIEIPVGAKGKRIIDYQKPVSASTTIIWMSYSNQYDPKMSIERPIQVIKGMGIPVMIQCPGFCPIG